MLEQGSGELVLQLGELSQSLALVVLGIRMPVQFLAYWLLVQLSAYAPKAAVDYDCLCPCFLTQEF